MLARMKALTVVPRTPGSGAVRDVSDPVARDGETMVEVVRVGLCGTDAEIERGEYGSAPPGSDLLVLGHESLGRIADDRGPLAKGTLVVASVRRPDGCPNCECGEQDMCLWGRFTERGIGGLHGYCAERYAERPEYLFPVDPYLEPVAVLLEPLTVSEKGIRHLWAAQRRMTVWEPKTALVTGAGPVGILAAVALRLRGLEVTVVERTHKAARGELLGRIGASYAATERDPLSSLGGFDVALEATGSSAVAFGAIELLDPNGAIVLTSVTGGGRRIELPADELNQRIVLRNLLVLGSVNANALDFRQGITDLGAAEKHWPGFLGSLITRRVPLADAASALPHDPAQIKTVVEIAS